MSKQNSGQTEDEHHCEEMDRFTRDTTYPIVYNERFREYGIRILDGGSAVQLIAFCPWDGSRLPESLRDAWFDAIQGLGLEPGDARIPERFRSSAWWRIKPS